MVVSMAKTKTKTKARGSAVARKVPPKRRTAAKPAAKKPVRRTAAKKVTDAARLYQAFHGEAPRQVKRVAHRDVKEAMALGRLEAVTYLTPDGKLYKHTFVGAARPILAASHDGRQLIVLGGRYRMTWRGIVDQRKKG